MGEKSGWVVLGGYRVLNHTTLRDRYTIPHIYDLSNCLWKKRMFQSLICYELTTAHLCHTEGYSRDDNHKIMWSLRGSLWAFFLESPAQTSQRFMNQVPQFCLRAYLFSLWARMNRKITSSSASFFNPLGMMVSLSVPPSVSLVYHLSNPLVATLMANVFDS